MANTPENTIYNSTSRLKLTDMVNYKGHVSPAMMKRFEFLDRSKIGNDGITRIEVLGNRGGRPDLISLDIYGTPMFKWILILFNNVENPLDGWPKVGSVIEAPIRSLVWREL